MSTQYRRRPIGLYLRSVCEQLHERGPMTVSDLRPLLPEAMRINAGQYVTRAVAHGFITRSEDGICQVNEGWESLVQSRHSTSKASQPRRKNKAEKPRISRDVFRAWADCA